MKHLLARGVELMPRQSLPSTTKQVNFFGFWSICPLQNKTIYSNVLQIAIFSILRLLIESGYPISSAVACAAVNSNNKSLIDFMLSQGTATFVKVTK